MSATDVQLLETPLVLHFGPVLRRLSNSEFYQFCQLNRGWQIERTSEGDLIIMPPAGGNTGRRNLDIATQLGLWSRRDGSGVGFDSSTGFRLPNGAERSPDAAWIRRERWESLTDDERDEFPPLAPDFIVELRSKSDSIESLRAKMREYIANGTSLGWLIDPESRTVEIYRTGQEMAVVDNPSLSGDPELPGFLLRLDQVWM